MSKTYEVIFVIKAPEGWDLDPYPFDALFEDQGAEVEGVGVEEVEE